MIFNASQLTDFVSHGETIALIEEWARAKDLHNADPKAQLCKLLEESGELAEGILKGRPEQVKDSIGDCVVVLTILAMQTDMTLFECVDYAYNEIKERTGKMVDGVFVKVEDL